MFTAADGAIEAAAAAAAAVAAAALADCKVTVVAVGNGVKHLEQDRTFEAMLFALLLATFAAEAR